MIVSAIWTRIATAATVPPTAKGAIAVTQALGIMAVSAAGATVTGTTARFISLDEQLPSLKEFSSTLVRTLVVPGLVEELLWRVLFQPPTMPAYQIVAINVAFAFYHVFGSTWLAEHLDGREGARDVFRDPAFLSLAFILGNTCSYAYIKAGYALWAPVVVHSIPVAVWLTIFGGDRALRTCGGLAASSSLQSQREGENLIIDDQRLSEE